MLISSSDVCELFIRIPLEPKIHIKIIVDSIGECEACTGIAEDAEEDRVGDGRRGNICASV